MAHTKIKFWVLLFFCFNVNGAELTWSNDNITFILKDENIKNPDSSIGISTPLIEYVLEKKHKKSGKMEKELIIFNCENFNVLFYADHLDQLEWKLTMDGSPGRIFGIYACKNFSH